MTLQNQINLDSIAFKISKKILEKAKQNKDQ